MMLDTKLTHDVVIGSPALKVSERSSSGMRAPFNPAQVMQVR